MRSDACVRHNDQDERSEPDSRALKGSEQAAYEELNEFLAGLVRQQPGYDGSAADRAASMPGLGVAARDKNRRWSVKVPGVDRLSDVVAMCKRLETTAGVRLVRVSGLTAKHVHLALMTAPGIDKAAMETLLTSLIPVGPGETSFEIEESGRSGSRSTVRR